MVFVMMTNFDKVQILARAAALRRFNDWEARHPIEMGEQEALAAIGAVYELVPHESRRRAIDPSGVGAMRKALCHLKGGS
jgi:hypothetical protein